MEMKFFTGNIRAMRWVSIAFGLMASVTGIMSGIYEILQGNYPTNAFKISSIDPVYSMWEESTYVAYTIIPNYLLTGIITLFVSILVTIWVLFFIHKKYGSIVMVLLSLFLILFKIINEKIQPYITFCCFIFINLHKS